MSRLKAPPAIKVKFANEATIKLAKKRGDQLLKVELRYDVEWDCFVYQILHNTGGFFPNWNPIETKKCILSTEELEEQKGPYLSAMNTDFLVTYFSNKQM